MGKHPKICYLDPPAMTFCQKNIEKIFIKINPIETTIYRGVDRKDNPSWSYVLKNIANTFLWVLWVCLYSSKHLSYHLWRNSSSNSCFFNHLLKAPVSSNFSVSAGSFNLGDSSRPVRICKRSELNWRYCNSITSNHICIQSHPFSICCLKSSPFTLSKQQKNHVQQTNQNRQWPFLNGDPWRWVEVQILCEELVTFRQSYLGSIQVDATDVEECVFRVFGVFVGKLYPGTCVMMVLIIYVLWLLW